MKLTRCEKLHYYDSDKYAVCPHCERSTSSNFANEPTIKSVSDQSDNKTISLNQIIKSRNFSNDNSIDNEKSEQLSIVNEETSCEDNNYSYPLKERIKVNKVAIKPKETDISYKNSTNDTDSIFNKASHTISISTLDSNCSNSIESKNHPSDSQDNLQLELVKESASNQIDFDGECKTLDSIEQDLSISKSDSETPFNDTATAFLNSLPIELRKKYSSVDELMNAIYSNNNDSSDSKFNKNNCALDKAPDASKSKIKMNENGITISNSRMGLDHVRENIRNISSTPKLAAIKDVLNRDVGESLEQLISRTDGHFTEDGNLYLDNKNVLLKYLGTSSIVELPSIITGIGKYAFSKNNNVKKVVLPHSVRFIGKYAFALCSELEQISIPHSVKSIGENAFIKCSKLKRIDLPNSVKSIGKGCFAKCNSLEEVVIPDRVQEIPSLCFFSCSSLRKVIFSLGNIVVGEGAFSECYSLKNVIFSDSITTVENNAFSWCQSLEKMELSHSVHTIGSWAFYGCQKLVDISISVNAKNIKKDAFFGCNSLYNINVLELNNPYKTSSDIKKAHRFAYKVLKQIGDARAERYAREHHIGII